MRYDDESYFDDEEDKDFWAAELELSSGEGEPQDAGHNEEPDYYYSDP